jgi:hypothetical protein
LILRLAHPAINVAVYAGRNFFLLLSLPVLVVAGVHCGLEFASQWIKKEIKQTNVR